MQLIFIYIFSRQRRSIAMSEDDTLTCNDRHAESLETLLRKKLNEERITVSRIVSIYVPISAIC